MNHPGYLNCMRILIYSLFFVWQTLNFLFAQETDFHVINSRIPVSNQIDSLIKINRINSQTLLIRFGPDAITAINTRNGIVVIDAGISMGLTLKYRKIIEKEFTGLPIKYVINTHAHPDHYGGNSVFAQADVVGHKNGIDEIQLQWRDTTKVVNHISEVVGEYETKLQNGSDNSEDEREAFIQTTRYKYALADAQGKDFIRIPNVTFSDSLELEMGELKFELKFFGKCHSNSDILIYIPELKILFTGDLLFKYGRASINNEQMADKNQWHNALHWLENRIPETETIISGHGEILSVDDLQSFCKVISVK